MNFKTLIADPKVHLVPKFILVSALIGFASSFLALSLKHLTEHYEAVFFSKAENSTLSMIIFPFIGLSFIYFLRQYLFAKKQNKGITEVIESTGIRNRKLPVYKIPSHFFNGLITVVFGGSTGIEVSTVVATAAIGSTAAQKSGFIRHYKTELICAGIAAGITALFGSPIAGILFAVEVISRKATRAFLLSTIVSVLVAFAFIYLSNEPPLVVINVASWHYAAIPYFLILGILAGLNSVYLTKCVIYFKSTLAQFEQPYYKVVVGSAILSSLLLLLPQLYGDGWHSLKYIFHNTDVALTTPFVLSIIGILILKPVATSITLAAGGDGGVFAPSLFIGAFLGLLLSTFLNTFFEANVIPMNFMILGMAAVLSASIHAPFTALFLVCSIVNDYTLFVPILAVCLVSKFTAKMIYPYTVYTRPAKST